MFSPPIYADEPLTWEDCLMEAKENHPDLITAREKVEQAIQDKGIAVGDILPQVSLDASGKKSKSGAGSAASTYKYGLSAQQLLFDGFKSSSGIKAAQEDIKSSQYDHDVASSNIRLRLRSAFIELLRAEELLKITDDIAGRRRKNLELVQLRYDAGREHRGSLFKERANLAQAEFEVAQARRNIELSQRRLVKELGRESFSPVAVNGRIEMVFALEEEPDFDKLPRDNPLLKELIAKKESARLGIQSAKADFFPEVYTSASAGKTGSEFLPEGDEWSAGLTVSFPIFEGAKRFAELKKARAKFRQSEAEEKSGRDGVVFTLREAWIVFKDAADAVDVRLQFLNAAQERSKIAQAQYSNGLISFDNWTIIEDDLARDKKAYLESLADAQVAEAYWLQAKGVTLDENTQ
ncbi:TolC family protein [Candidatus Omnitrophota bacterium]